MIFHYKYEMAKAYFEKHVSEKKLRDIINNLEEAIITKSENGIGFCNSLGYSILNDAYKHQTNEHNIISLNQNNEGKGQKSKFLQLYENITLSAKIFKLHQTLTSCNNSGKLDEGSLANLSV